MELPQECITRVTVLELLLAQIVQWGIRALGSQSESLEEGANALLKTTRTDAWRAT